MMQKMHSGVVAHSEGEMVRIEGIDLKVWERITISHIFNPLHNCSFGFRSLYMMQKVLRTNQDECNEEGYDSC